MEEESKYLKSGDEESSKNDQNQPRKTYEGKNQYRKTSNSLNYMKEQLEWVKRQIQYASFSESYRLMMECRPGEIYEIDWGYNVNAEFSNRHYGVVLNYSGKNNPLVLICPLKTNHKGAHPVSDVDIGIVESLSTEVKTIAVINQVRSLDKLRIYSRSAISESNLYNNGQIPKISDYQLDKILTYYVDFILKDKPKNI